jgi:hypothetical protein
MASLENLHQAAERRGAVIVGLRCAPPPTLGDIPYGCWAERVRQTVTIVGQEWWILLRAAHD